MRRLLKAALRIAGIGAVTYIAALFLILSLRHDFIYPFSDRDAAPADAGAPSLSVGGIAAPSGPLPVWIAEPKGDSTVIIFFMGNGGALPLFAPRLEAFAQAGLGVVAMAYRGGGGVPGEPSEAQLISDARATYDAVDQLLGAPIAADRRVIYGFSLGAGIATALAAEVEAAALILEAPFDRLCNAAKNAYPIFPACAIMWDERYDNIDRIAGVDAPLLIMHGSEDSIIPHSLGRRLFDAAREPKTFVSIEGGGHNDLSRFGVVEAGISFAREHAGIR